MKTNVIIKLQVEGLHHWPGVIEHPELEQVHFLKAVHRHVFHITAKKEVTHDDRDIEIIMLKRNILEYLNKRYWVDSGNTHFFGSMSCEMIANELVKYFALSYCEVLEDGENGAEVIEKVKQIPTEVITKDRKVSTTFSETVPNAPWVTTTTVEGTQLKFTF